MDKSTLKTMFSSATGNWATPQEFFDKLSWRFGPFDLDPCASIYNTKCANFFTEAENGLEKDWEAYNESKKENTKVVMLIPARTDTKYWHNYVMKASEIHFVKGRLKFGDSQNPAPFPSAVVVFDGGGELWRVEGINR